MFRKRGLSEVVSVVLIVVLTIGAVALIANFLIPFIRDQLDYSKDCYGSLGGLEVIYELGNVKTCYDPNLGEANIIISRSNSFDSELYGLVISLMKTSGESERFDIYNNTITTNVGMYQGAIGSELELPSPGTEKTYVFNSADVEKVQIAVILKNNKLCKESQVYEVPEC